jgi:hypothetical protein
VRAIGEQSIAALTITIMRVQGKEKQKGAQRMQGQIRARNLLLYLVQVSKRGG